MRQTVQNKINDLKVLSKDKGKSNSKTSTSGTIRIVNDNLSKSIRTKKDAEIFRKELNVAFEVTVQ